MPTPWRTKVFTLFHMRHCGSSTVYTVLARCSGVSVARKASAALRTGSVETPVERMGKRPGCRVPFEVMPLKGKASSLSSWALVLARRLSRKSS